MICTLIAMVYAMTVATATPSAIFHPEVKNAPIAKNHRRLAVVMPHFHNLN